MESVEQKKRGRRKGLRLLAWAVAAVVLAGAAGYAYYLFGGRPRDGVIIDFEDAGDMDRLKWECHDAFERGPAISGQGAFALHADLAPGQYPGVDIFNLPRNWSGYRNLEFTVEAPDAAGEPLHIRIDDKEVADAYTDRYEGQARLTGDAQKVVIPLTEIRNQPVGRKFNFRSVELMIFYLYDRKTRTHLTIDDVRLTK